MLCSPENGLLQGGLRSGCWKFDWAIDIATLATAFEQMEESKMFYKMKGLDGDMDVGS